MRKFLKSPNVFCQEVVIKDPFSKAKKAKISAPSSKQETSIEPIYIIVDTVPSDVIPEVPTDDPATDEEWKTDESDGAITGGEGNNGGNSGTEGGGNSGTEGGNEGGGNNEEQDTPTIKRMYNNSFSNDFA